MTETTEIDVVATAKDMEIQTNEQLESAGALLQQVKAMMKAIEEDQGPVCQAAHNAWKTALATKKAHLEPLESAERIIKGKVATYLDRKAREEAAERARQLAEAEAKARAEREAKIKQALEDAEAAAEERDEITAAMALDEAEMLEAAPVIPIVAPPPVEAPKPKGLSSSVVYDFEVINFAALPDDYKIADDKKIRAIVRAHKGIVTIPGVKITQRRSVAQRV